MDLASVCVGMLGGGVQCVVVRSFWVWWELGDSMEVDWEKLEGMACKPAQ